MSWYEDDFYNEPSEFETQMEEFKESLAKAIKSEFLEEMERLKKENRNLQGIKKNFEQIKTDYEQKKSECDKAMRKAEDNAKHMKIEELMERFRIFFWHPNQEYLYGPKCDKCDESRRIKVVLPSGAIVHDNCQCINSRRNVMFPGRMVLYTLEDRRNGIAAFYSPCGEKGGRYYRLEYVSSVGAKENMVQPGTGFDVLEKNETQGQLLFPTREDCLAYCTYLNKKNGIPDDVVYKINGDRYKEEIELEEEPE